MDVVLERTDVEVGVAFPDTDIVSEVIDVLICGEFPEIAVRKGAGLIDAVVDVK